MGKKKNKRRGHKKANQANKVSKREYRVEPHDSTQDQAARQQAQARLEGLRVGAGFQNPSETFDDAAYPSPSCVRWPGCDFNTKGRTNGATHTTTYCYNLTLYRAFFFTNSLHAIHVSTISGKLSFCHFATEFSKN